jgi:hypothetical protein
MRLEDGIVIFGGDALAGSKGLSPPGGLQREGLLDTELAGQDVAMESKSTGVGSALVSAGHGKFSVVRFSHFQKLDGASGSSGVSRRDDGRGAPNRIRLFIPVKVG